MTTNNKKPIIKKVYSNKKSGQKLVSVPSDSDIKVGDFVCITPLEILSQKVKIDFTDKEHIDQGKFWNEEEK